MHGKLNQGDPSAPYYRLPRTVECFDCDSRNQMKVSAALRMMQQIGSDQIISLGFSIDQILEEGFALMLWKICLKVNRMPRCGESIWAGTIPVGAVRSKLRREYIVETPENERLISAFSLWLLVDPKTRKIIKPAKFPYDWDLRPPMVEDQIGDIPLPEKIPPQEPTLSVPIRYSQVDWNGHVNNTVYVDLVCDALPYELMAHRELDTFTICYRKEVLPGDIIHVSATEINNEYYLRGTKQEPSDGKRSKSEPDHKDSQIVSFEALVGFK